MKTHIPRKKCEQLNVCVKGGQPNGGGSLLVVHGIHPIDIPSHAIDAQAKALLRKHLDLRRLTNKKGHILSSPPSRSPLAKECVK